MAKVITQETYDAVVKENMQEFEMSAEEAVSDAVEQFQSQVSGGCILWLLGETFFHSCILFWECAGSSNFSIENN